MTETVFTPSNLENIDSALFEWVDEYLNIFCQSEEGWRKVPVIFSSPERAWMSKALKDLHDNKHTLKYPIISVSRKNINRPKQKNAALPGSYLGNTELSGSLTIFKKLNSGKTADRANMDSLRSKGVINFPKKKTNRPIYDIYKIPFPTFVILNYEISIRTNFQEQMNEIISPFLKHGKNTHGFKLLKEGHSYECFIGEGMNNSSNQDNIDAEERRFEYTFTMDMYGYLMHGESNDKGPTVVVTQNRPEVVIKTEFIYTGSLEDL